jgi:SAM-dependent methyltransferase
MVARHCSSCRICGSTSLRDLGPIYHQESSLIAGVPIDLSHMQFSLLQCHACGFAFKDPPIPEDKLMACYGQAAANHWGHDPDPEARRFFDIRDEIERLKPERGRILDIGCANGSLLRHFADGWHRYAVEPSISASEVARSRGIDVLGHTLDDVPREMRFDVILAIDVVEHIVDPMPFFRKVAGLLEPGGLFFVVTGDTDAWTWRLERSRYWYCSLPEHVSFYNQRCFEEIGRRTGIATVGLTRANHARCPISDHSVQMLKNAAFLVGFWGRGFGIPPLRRIFLQHHAPSWMPARDHIYVAGRMSEPAAIP